MSKRTIDPSDYATQNFDDDKPVSKKLTAGRKEMAPVGCAYKIIREKKVLEVGFVCLKDLENTSEEGAIFLELFYLTEKALWRLSNWVLAMNWGDVFNPDSLEDIKKIMLRGSFVGVFEDREYTNNSGDLVKYLNLKWFNRTRSERNEFGAIEFDDEQVGFLSRAEKGYSSLVKYKQEKYGDKYITDSKSEIGDENYGDYNDEGEVPF